MSKKGRGRRTAEQRIQSKQRRSKLATEAPLKKRLRRRGVDANNALHKALEKFNQSFLNH